MFVPRLVLLLKERVLVVAFRNGGGNKPWLGLGLFVLTLHGGRLTVAIRHGRRRRRRRTRSLGLFHHVDRVYGWRESFS